MSEDVAAQQSNMTATGGEQVDTQPAVSDMSSSSDIAKMPEAPEFNVPEAYADRGWVKTVRSEEDLWSQLDNAQNMIGKRSAVPADDAPQEDWDKFYKSAGRPDEPTGYELPLEFEGAPDGFSPESFSDTAKGMFHEAGLNKQQADKMWKLFVDSEIELANEGTAAYSEKSKELKEKYLPSDAEALTSNTDKAIAKYLPEELHEGLASSLGGSPETQIAFAKLYEGMQAEIDAVKKEYGSEGSVTSGDQSSNRSVDTVRSELAKLRVSEAARNFDHHGHKDAISRIEELSASLGKMMR